MKLNSEIVFSELSKRYDAEFYKSGNSEMSLGRPEFYMDDEDEFLGGHLYLATVEHLPQRPRIHRNVVLVCIGDGMSLNYYRERLDLILIKSRADFFKVYQVLQETFDKYDEWEKALLQDVLRDTDIKTMIDDSSDIFKMPVYVLDKSFRFLAASSASHDASWKQEGSETLNPDSLSKFLNAENMMTDKKNAFTLNIMNKPVLCVNLFGRGGEYSGCLCLDIKGRDPEPGTDKLAEALASFIELAFERNPKLQREGQASVKRLAQTLIEEQPLSRSQRVLLRSVNGTQPYICIYFRSTERYQQLPLSYICGVFEETFKDSHAFVNEDGIVGLMNVSDKDAPDFKLNLTRDLRSFCQQMRLSAGVSGDFTDFFNIRVNYLQAQSALEDGRLLNSEDILFFFSSYALTEMIINSLGGLPAEAFFPEGMKAIYEHDSKSPVSYLETLKAFLEENLSYTATAQRLFIHRSTLIDRIERIEREMNIDLKNPDQRLQIEILLKAIELEDVIRKQ